MELFRWGTVDIRTTKILIFLGLPLIMFNFPNGNKVADWIQKVF